MMLRYGMDAAGTHHENGRDMVLHMKSEVLDTIRTYFEVFMHHTLGLVCLKNNTYALI